MPTPKAIWVPDEPYNSGIQEILIGRIFAIEKLEGYIGRNLRSDKMSFTNTTMYAGNNKQYTIHVKDEKLEPVDLTGGRAIFTWKDNSTDSIILTKDTANGATDGHIVNALDGEVFFYINPADTENLETDKQYAMDITIIDAVDNIYTVIEGVITLKSTVRI